MSDRAFGSVAVWLREFLQTAFRMVPWPTEPGLRVVGQPGESSPVIVTGNYDLTVRRVLRALEGLDAEVVEAADCADGMSASLRAGLAAVSEEADAVMVVLADMPEIGADVMGKLIAAFDAGEGREICRAVAADGTPGHPVLFGRRFFEALAGLTGDRGAREVVRAAGEFVVDVPTNGKAAITDLDTPEAWAAWRALSDRRW